MGNKLARNVGFVFLLIKVLNKSLNYVSSYQRELHNNEAEIIGLKCGVLNAMLSPGCASLTLKATIRSSWNNDLICNLPIEVRQRLYWG